MHNIGPQHVFFRIYWCFELVSLQGTQLYDPKAGGWRDLGMLDVMQVIFTTVSH